jgi:hypothetical protein
VAHNSRHGSWFVVDTENFQICCQSQEPADHLARHAESLRAAFHAKWFCVAPKTTWNPRCQIVLHASQRSYVEAVGRGSEQTVGSSLVTVDKGQITGRRIDLLGGTEFLSDALPHELTHVVLRERFIKIVLPRWADEGTAILADTRTKQGQHHGDLRAALVTRSTFHAARLLTMQEYPGPEQMGVFYGQSASLAKFLIDRKGHENFVQFIEQAADRGYDAALRQFYDISSVAELDRQWRRHASGQVRLVSGT